MKTSRSGGSRVTYGEKIHEIKKNMLIRGNKVVYYGIKEMKMAEYIGIKNYVKE